MFLSRLWDKFALTDKLAVGLQGSYLREAFKENASDALEGLNVESNHFFIGFFTALRFDLGSWYLSPRAGGGYIL